MWGSRHERVGSGCFCNSHLWSLDMSEVLKMKKCCADYHSHLGGDHTFHFTLTPSLSEHSFIPRFDPVRNADRPPQPSALISGRREKQVIAKENNFKQVSVVMTRPAGRGLAGGGWRELGSCWQRWLAKLKGEADVDLVMLHLKRSRKGFNQPDT